MPHMTPGKYKAQCTGHEYAESKTGKTYIACRFEVPTDDGAKFITWMGFFTEKTRERTFEALKYMGWDGKSLSELGPLNLHVQLDVVNEEYQGREHSKVAWVNKLGGGGLKSAKVLTVDEVRQFAASMQRHIKTVVEEGSDDGLGW